jgi:hypothetical protein
MKTISSWDAVLAAPAPRDHLVQLYTSDDALVSTVARFIEHGIVDAAAVIAVATAAHWTAVVTRLRAGGMDVAALQARGQLIVLDAYGALARLLRDGLPDREAMRDVIMPAIATARAAGYETIRTFGEMVDILNRRGSLAAAIRLEELWNELLEAERIALLCAYAIDPFDRAAYTTTLPSIGRVHSHLMPVEDCARLERAIDRAFVDVFGLYGDSELLRELFVRQLPDAVAMPTAQAALFALRGIDTRLADSVLERAAAHYHAS